ncbi:hypothetical protein Cgig2_012606 [Carnegiea gigantea]|uniref:Meiosis-specific protein ASY3-like coiled-coil domain-containing protein n=1 Tax=Carnegiea gigantea TaxID=171969 RepID=A0A9Q1GQZ8_9CARY|nr:hypothetical protein Cgig2_012606 [Carnegiea gigantea]
MSYCRSSRFNYLPCSQSQKMSIGMVVDSFDKPRFRSTKDAEVSITHAEREASGHVGPNMKKNFMSFGTVNAAQDCPAMIKTSQLNDNALINDNNHVYKQASTSSVVSFREKQTRHPFHLIPNQTVLQPVTGEKIETGGTVSRKEGKKNSVAERYGEFACGDEQEVSMPVKDMLHEQPDKMENRCKETLRMKLQEILGTIPSVDKKCDNSRTGEVVANEVMQVQTDGGDAQFKHKQNSDTIETDSEKADKTIRRPVTCLLARKRAPAKSRSVNLKTKSLLRDNEEHQSSHVFSFVEKYMPLKSSGENLCRSRTEMLENVKQSSGVRPDDMTHDIVDVVNIQRVITGDKTVQPEEELLLEGRMMSPQHGHQYENLEPEAAMQNKNFHCSPVIKEKDQLQNVECPVSPEVPDHQKSLSSQSPVDDNDNLDSPFLKMAKTVHNSLVSHQLHRFVQEEGANVTYEFKFSPATEDNTGSSDEEDTYNTIPEPLATENAKNGLLSPEGRVFDSSEEVLSAEKEIGVAKKPLLFQTKRHCSSGVDHSNSSPAVQSPEASESSNDELLEPLENGDEDEFARVVSLLGLALERVKTKMMSATNKRCSDILVSAAEEIHLQLYNAESQIQTDSWFCWYVRGRLTSLSKLKRKHLETRLQEQQEHLKVIYDKFRKEIHQYIQDSRGALEQLEAEHAELKGAIERRST